MLFPLHESGAKFIILGDLNADPSTLEGEKLDEFIESNSLFSFISEPTRITDTSATRVDQIITNLPDMIKSTKIEPPISSNDHCNISATLSFKKKKQLAYKRVMWDYKNADFDLFHLSSKGLTGKNALNLNLIQIEWQKSGQNLS